MEYTPKKVFVLEGTTYLELSYAEFRQQASTYQGRRFIPLHGMLMEVSEDAYKAFYKDKRRQKYLNERSNDNGDFSYDMLTTDEFNGEDILVDEVADTAGEAEKNLLLDKLRQAITLLSADEQRLLHQLFNQRLSERTIADMYSVSQVAIHMVKEDEAAVIRRIFDLYLQGVGKQNIANILNAEGVPRRYDQKKWHHTTIDYVIKNGCVKIGLNQEPPNSKGAPV